MAEANQQRAKYMWDYTNFENQKQHLLNANLSPGLFYGGSGAGGSTTSGGQGSGVGLGMETGVGYGIQEKALGLQLASMASQVALNQSQANKNNAEAKKISGADTQLTESQTSLNKAMEKQTNTKEQREAADYFVALQEQSKVFEEARAMALQNDITEATKQTQKGKNVLLTFIAAQNWRFEKDSKARYKNNSYIQSAGLTELDELREKILEKGKNQFIIGKTTNKYFADVLGESGNKWNIKEAGCGLLLKTYQSDIFNNWIKTEWIDGENGISAITAISTTGDKFTIDQLNLSKKVYDMLNRIAVSGGTVIVTGKQIGRAHV